MKVDTQELKDAENELGREGQKYWLHPDWQVQKGMHRLVEMHKSTHC